MVHVRVSDLKSDIADWAFTCGTDIEFKLEALWSHSCQSPISMGPALGR